MVALPTIQKMVYNRIPFLVTGATNNTLIDEFNAEVFAEVYNPFDIKEDDMMDDTKYSNLQKSLVADMVAVYMLKRKILINKEGDANTPTAAIPNKSLKKAKAGEAEAEWDLVKADNMVSAMLSAKDLLTGLMQDAGRKANSMGFSLDMRIDGQWVIDALSWPLPGVQSVSFKCD